MFKAKALADCQGLSFDIVFDMFPPLILFVPCRRGQLLFCHKKITPYFGVCGCKPKQGVL